VLDRDVLTASARVTVSDPRSAATPTDREASPARATVAMPQPLRVLLAAVSGAAVGFAFQPYGIWPLAFLGIAGLTLAANGTRPRRAFLCGYLFGLAMLLVAINWVRVIVGGGGVAMLGVGGLIAFEALFFGLLGIAIRLLGRLRFWPVLLAAAWVGVEYLYGHYPFGGFGWARVAYTAVDTPLAGFLPIIGVTGLTFLVALLAQCLAWLVITMIMTRPGVLRRSMMIKVLVPPLAAWVALLGVGLGLRGWSPDPESGTGRSAHVGIVQGNVPGHGIEAMGRMRTVTANHVAETRELVDAARSGQHPQPDFILWPENSTDMDPTLDAITENQVQSAAATAGKPIFVGAVMQGPGPDERQTSGLWWDPERGILARYDKRNLVPFGEWIPFRDQLLPVFPVLQLVGAQGVPGTEPGALRVPLSLGGGPEQQVVVGDAICFELAYDDSIYDVITGGAQLFMVQSNNATYAGTGQVDQQFAITRARAMETRREIAVSTTNGVSGFIGRDGEVRWQTRERTADSTVVTMPLRTAITPAVRIAPWLERGLAAVALLGCIGAVIIGRRTRLAR
jgi:apolipoprotein N-acyltransferase